MSAINTDRWHPYIFDTWHSFQVFSNMPLAYFQVTHITSLSTTHQHGDIWPPCQIILQEVLLFNIKSSTPPQRTLLVDPKVGGE